MICVNGLWLLLIVRLRLGVLVVRWGGVTILTMIRFCRVVLILRRLGYRMVLVANRGPCCVVLCLRILRFAIRW